MLRSIIALLFAVTAFGAFAGTTAAQDIDCPQVSFEEAQQILAEDPSDPNGLDRDNDGIACENNARGDGTDGGNGEETEEPDEEVTEEVEDESETVTSVGNTGVGTAAATQSSGVLVAGFLALATLFGAMGVRVARRRA